MNRFNFNRPESSNMSSSTEQQTFHNQENAAIEASLAVRTRRVIETIRPANTNSAYCHESIPCIISCTYFRK